MTMPVGDEMVAGVPAKATIKTTWEAPVVDLATLARAVQRFMDKKFPPNTAVTFSWDQGQGLWYMMIVQSENI